MGLEWLRTLSEREWLESVGTGILVGLYALAAAGVAMRRLHWRHAAFAAVLLFLILNKIFSVQYAIWVLPFFVVLRLPAWSYVNFAFADLAVSVTLFPMFTAFGSAEEFEAAYDKVAVAVVWRFVALAILLGIVASQSFRRTRETNVAPAVPPLAHG